MIPRSAESAKSVVRQPRRPSCPARAAPPPPASTRLGTSPSPVVVVTSPATSVVVVVDSASVVVVTSPATVVVVVGGSKLHVTSLITRLLKPVGSPVYCTTAYALSTLPTPL